MSREEEYSSRCCVEVQAPTTDKSVTANRRAFRTPAGVLIAAETLQGGTRLYSPILATWARVLNDRLSASPSGSGSQRGGGE